MTIDWIILFSSWLLVALALFLFIPRSKIRVAVVSFLFKHLLTWILGLITVEMGLLSYPTRLFATVNRTSFTYEFFAFPAISAIFIVRFPSRHSIIIKLIYYASFCTVMTIVEVVLESHTQLIQYVHWKWYWTWISLFIVFWISRLFYIFFFERLPRITSESDAKI